MNLSTMCDFPLQNCLASSSQMGSIMLLPVKMLSVINTAASLHIISNGSGTTEAAWECLPVQNWMDTLVLTMKSSSAIMERIRLLCVKEDRYRRIINTYLAILDNSIGIIGLPWTRSISRGLPLVHTRISKHLGLELLFPLSI